MGTVNPHSPKFHEIHSYESGLNNPAVPDPPSDGGRTIFFGSDRPTSEATLSSQTSPSLQIDLLPGQTPLLVRPGQVVVGFITLHMR